MECSIMKVTVVLGSFMKYHVAGFEEYKNGV